MNTYVIQLVRDTLQQANKTKASLVKCNKLHKTNKESEYSKTPFYIDEIEVGPAYNDYKKFCVGFIADTEEDMKKAVQWLLGCGFGMPQVLVM